MTRLLVNAFRTILALTPKDLLPVVYLCTGSIAPAHEGIELGIGDAILIKVRIFCSNQQYLSASCIICTQLEILSECSRTF